MRLNIGGVDGHRTVHARRTRQRVEDIRPDSLPAPAVEAIVDRRIGTIDFRTIAPARSRVKHMHDAAYHTPVVDTMRSAPTPRQQRLDPAPLRLAQPIDSLRHPKPSESPGDL